MPIFRVPCRVQLATLALFVSVTVALTSCTPSKSPASSVPAGAGTAGIVPTASTLRWHACSAQLAGLQCASLQVPLDYADPGGRKITLALSMVPATAPRSQQQGVMLVNPGGPGAPGRALAASVADGLNPKVAADYDIVGFDTRGVGASVPALSCDPSFFKGVRPDYIPANAAAEQVLIDRAKTYAAGCEKRFGWLLPYLTTVNMARDMDQIRKAFGVRKINYYAFSYGTYLGQVYGTLFPGRVRRMVLDSTVDPTGAWYADNISQDYAFQKRIEAFFGWTAKYDSTYHLGSTVAQVQASYYEARKRLAKDPASGLSGPMVGPSELDDTILWAGYLDLVWPDFARALSQYLRDGNSSDLISQYQQWGVQNENSFAIYNAVECGDVNWPRNWSKWQSDTLRVYKTAPFDAWDNAWFNAACAFWPVKGPATPFKVDGSGLPPVLMLQGTLDAATPYAGAQDAHRLLPSARMVVVTGSGNHGQSHQFPPDPCVQRYLNSYLATGAVPSHPGLVNATCPAMPAPTPLSPGGTTPRTPRCAPDGCAIVSGARGAGVVCLSGCLGSRGARWSVVPGSRGAGVVCLSGGPGTGLACLPGGPGGDSSCRLFPGDAGAATLVTMLRVRQRSEQARLLDDRDRDAVLELCGADPVANVFVESRIRVFGLEPGRLGAQIWGFEQGGRLVSLCYSGANLVPVQATPAAVAAFADRALRQGRRCSSLVGPSAAVSELWALLRTSWGPARDVRAAQPLMAIDGPPGVAPDPVVRRVRPDEIGILLPAAIAMFTEEVGVSPLTGDGGVSYRARVSELVRAGRAFARIEDGQVIFKAEVGAATPRACQVQGVWVNPAYRGRGIAPPGMAAVVKLARESVSPVVSLYVNDFNAPARAAYRRAGFREVGEFMSVLF